MAGDWIKMRMNLRTHPKVVRMASALSADRLRVIGGLHAVWCMADEHTEDGSLPGYSLSALDESINWPGFAKAMKDIDWLIEDTQGIVFPRFDEHNGASAKRRAQESERKRRDRNTSATDADKKRTREEKRRGSTPVSPKASSDSNVAKRTRKPASGVPESFDVSDEMAQWAVAEGLPAEQVLPETAKCLDHFRGKGAVKADWMATWRNWIRKSVEYRAQR